METRTIEYKSLQKIRTGDKGFRDLSTTCVALANAQGGRIFIGYDDKTRMANEGALRKEGSKTDRVYYIADE